MGTKSKHENLFFALRVLLAFAVLAGLIVGIYFVAYRSYPAVAEWEREGSHEAFVMDGITYRRVGVIGKDGLKEKDYPIHKSVGRVQDHGAITETEPITLPPDAEPGETVKLPAPDGTPDLSRDHAYVLYSVEKSEVTLILLESDGSHVLYYREVAEWETPDSRSTMLHEEDSYILIGEIGQNGLDADRYAKDVKQGVIGTEFVYNVKLHAHLRIVEGADGTDLLYCRKDYRNPPETLSESILDTDMETE